MNRQTSDNSGHTATFCYAQISARSKENKDEKIKYKNSKIANNRNNKVI